jgi:ribonuclease HI
LNPEKCTFGVPKGKLLGHIVSEHGIVSGYVVLISPEGNRLRYAIRLHFPASNNVAKYKGLINGLRIAIELEATRLDVYGDSKLVVEQVMKESNCESSLMNAYCLEVHRLEDKFRGIKLHYVPWKDNNDADALAKMVAQQDPAPSGVFANDLHAPSICIKPDPPPRPSNPIPKGPARSPLNKRLRPSTRGL